MKDYLFMQNSPRIRLSPMMRLSDEIGQSIHQGKGYGGRANSSDIETPIFNTLKSSASAVQTLTQSHNRMTTLLLLYKERTTVQSLCK